MTRHLFPKGVSGNPAGKPKGIPDAVARVRKKAEEYDMLPLDFFLTSMNDTTLGRTFRADCAKAAAPYVHRKMPIAIDNGNGGPVTFATPEMLARLSPTDLKKLEEVMQKLAAIATPGIMMTAATTAALEEQKDEE